MAVFVDSLLKIADAPVLQQFLHDCVDDLIGAKEANFDNYNSDIEWTIEDFNNAKKSIQKIYRECIISDNFDPDVDLGENLQKEITRCLEVRKDDIFQVLVKEQLVHNGHNLVENFDWRLKYVLGNSKLASVREALLQVDLHYLKSNSNHDKICTDTCNFEMNLEMLDTLIEQLKIAKTELKNSKD